METTVTEQRKIEIDINLPHFCKKGDNYYKVISQEECIWMNKSEAYNQLCLCGTWLKIADIANSQKITENEFMEAYYEVKYRIDKDMPSPFELSSDQPINTESINQ